VRRKWILVTVSATALLALTVLYFRRPEPVPRVDPRAPMHFFVARDHVDRDELRCSFTLGLDRRRLHDMWSLPLQPCRLSRGWSVPNKRGVMAYAKTAEVEFFVEKTDWTHVVLRVKAVTHPSGDRTQKISIRLNGQRLSAVELPRGWQTIAIEIPPGELCSGLNTWTFNFAYRAPSTESRTSPSQPRFAVRLREISLVTAPPPRGPFVELRRRIARQVSVRPPSASTQVFDQKSGRFVIPTAGTLMLPMDLPANADRLEFSIVGSEPPDRDGKWPAVEVQGLGDGRSYSPVSATLEESVENTEHERRYRFAVDQFAGQACVLSIENGPVPEHAPIEISRPKLITRPIPTNDGSVPGRDAVTTSQPDIVLIILDAARPDHFSGYGYERLTTPAIDLLAAESLVFTNVFALVPNTHRSVPTMLTGLSFLDHGVTEDESVLDGSATTLAEYLRDAGYRTASFTANPNNSQTIGTEQGYDEFFELWTEVPRTTSRKPDYLAARTVAWLDAQKDSRPLHLQLHFVPPHAPYDPSPDFDLFSDSAYRGACDGNAKTLRAIDKGNLTATKEDLAHIRSLYDGNLRAADDAVAAVLQALRSRPRWENTVVLVTSDHGEAFFEHRRMLHNNTVYDEMLHVPFILRMPRGIGLDGVDTGQMATLADIVPTLLAAASIGPVAALDGIDLLGQPMPTRAAANRSMIARTAHPEPMRCLRTPRFKLILSPSGQVELYDLEADPGELRNVAYEHLPVTVGLAQLLTERLAAPPRLDHRARKEELPAEEREMLRTLGYLE